MYRVLNILLLLSAFIQTGSSDLLKKVKEKLDNNDIIEAQKTIEKITVEELLKSETAEFYYFDGRIKESINRPTIALSDYLKSKKLYIEIDSLDKAMEINLDIAFLICSQEFNKTDYSKYIIEYLEYAKKSKDPVKLSRGYGYYAMLKAKKNQADESKDFYNKALKYALEGNDKELESGIYNNLALLYNESLNKPDSALYYLKKDLKYQTEQKNYPALLENYCNQSSSYKHKKKYFESIKYLKKADSLPLEYSLPAKQYIYEEYYKNYDSLKDYKNAYKYALLAKKFADSANVIEQNIAINDIQTKYQTREKELENEVLKGKVKTNKALVYIVVGLLIASLIIGFLIVKNARRREHISKQEKLIEQQKLEKALKEYELSSIDLMLEGQEKERQRIANDLHDNLGSMLATLKINFEHLRLRKNELREEENKLYDRTDELIEEAYQKVRRLAHAKNAGVFANEGLIPTIRKMAEKISIPGKLSIEIMAVGFNKRLENTIEIAIFRMVQELSTNIIKHSQATEASIQLTNHDENINIIIEDNGVGFPPAKTHTSDGMGLNTIRKKVEQLGGTFTIDSTPGKGTTIIIDLPI
ncbi:sensor histidine kinase [Flavobacterium alkalisoli]|uniref:Oxygen sensor histidine kinase NreB n=1 Tax=Flavobacterium alkalisoli TaxID=2602769 RepID=A0A5B9G203_9FLAO|nr:sensor histidine kinase [Flavobacterium alkalisoli]QEE51107.1 sensor histidine kinase [Flavobacterium alkalisoli]